MNKKQNKKIIKTDEHPIIWHRNQRTKGQRATDKITEFIGSWTFILFFVSFLITWMLLNICAWWMRWDPYPFVLLNLVMSGLATIQAPIILMSGNRQAERDRIVAQYDYAVNRKTERTIEDLQKDLEKIKRMITELKK